MKKIFNRFLIMFLTLPMALGMLSFTVFAGEISAEEVMTEADDDIKESAEDTIYEMAYENIDNDYDIQADIDDPTYTTTTWSYDKITQTLTISGYGDMGDYVWSNGDFQPWFDYKHEIKHVIIENGVNNVGHGCFSGCDKIETVTIPESVTRIYNYAFEDCDSLQEITIPDSVYWVGYASVYGCDNLKRIKIGKGLNHIGKLAFNANRSLESIVVDPENPYYNDGNGSNALIQGNELIVGCKNTVIPDGITSIAENSFFMQEMLVNIEIPDSVTSIGDYAFDYCTGLANITIPDSVTSIGQSAFSDCIRLKNLIISGGVDNLGSYSFRGCTGLTNVIIKNGLTTLNEGVFHECLSLTNIFLPRSLVYIDNAFILSADNIKNVYYEGSLTDRKNIVFSVSGWNDKFNNATWHYNCYGTFWDISATDDWFYDDAEFVYSRGIMTGMGDTGMFAPGDPLHRQQFAVMLYRLEGSPSTSYTNKFPDVPDNTWYSLPIIWAYQNGIITGYENGCFGVGDNITREQLAVMLYRYAANHKHLDVSQTADISNFMDASNVSTWAKDAVQWAVGCGIISGKDNGTRIDPQGNAARSECAAMIHRFMIKYGL